MLATLLLATGLAPNRWYGPVKVTFDVDVPGSPYDASTNDVRVRFKAGAQSEERLAYFDGQHWDAFLLSHRPGDYTVEVTRNGTSLKRLANAVVTNTPSTTSFVRVDASHRAFETDDGKAFWPMGHNLAWHSTGLPPLTETLAEMGKAHMNWSRIWSNPWDGKDPWWPIGKEKLAIGDLSQSAFQIWDGILPAADRAGIHFQWVLFNHGLFSSIVDPEWKDNPWNVANGGFLSDPVDFFTNEKARQLCKSYLHYVVARYGHEPSIMGWELFNEVENTSAARTNHWEVIGPWHREMADYLRSIDPYHHLITSSSERRPEITAALDYYQVHGYPSNLTAMILGEPVPTDRPFFFGEIGLGSPSATDADQRIAIRDGIWDGLLAGHSGAGEYWYWDEVVNLHLQEEWSKAYAAMHELGIVPGPKVKPVTITADSGIGADMAFAPGLGWTASKQLDFELPKDASGPASGRLSNFLQGKAHPDMGSRVSFRIDAPSAGVASVSFGEAATNGAEIVARVDGVEASRVPVKGGKQDGIVAVKAPFGAGPHTVVFDNVGPDWVSVSSFNFTGIGPLMYSTAATENGRLLIRVQRATKTPGPIELSLSGLPLEDGRYRLSQFDLGTGKLLLGASTQEVCRNGRLNKPITVQEADGLIALDPMAR